MQDRLTDGGELSETASFAGSGVVPLVGGQENGSNGRAQNFGHAAWCAWRLGRNPWSQPPMKLLPAPRQSQGRRAIIGRVATDAALDCAATRDYYVMTAADVRLLYSTGRYLDPSAVASGKLE